MEKETIEFFFWTNGCLKFAPNWFPSFTSDLFTSFICINNALVDRSEINICYVYRPSFLAARWRRKRWECLQLKKKKAERKLDIEKKLQRKISRTRFVRFFLRRFIPRCFFFFIFFLEKFVAVGNITSSKGGYSSYH